jgi:hypothetical protein
VSQLGVLWCITLTVLSLGHFVVSELVDVVVNRRFPTYPRSYSFGKTQFVPKKQLAGIIQTIVMLGSFSSPILADLLPQVDSLASPDSETQPNDMVLVAHGVSGDLERLSELKIRKSPSITAFQTINYASEIPSNTLVLDTTAFERQLFRIGERPASIVDPHTSLSRQPGTTLSLANLLRSLSVDISQIVFHNSGNDAFAALVSLQLLLEPDTDTKLKKAREARDEEAPLSPASPKAPLSPPRPVGDPSEYPPVVPSGIARVVPASPVETSTRPAVEPLQPVAPAVPEKVPEAAAPARGKGQRRGRGRGGAKQTTQQQQQQRDARVENAMMNLEL